MRDFSVLIVASALAGHLEWMLWLAAVGAHVFWIGFLGLQLYMFRTTHMRKLLKIALVVAALAWAGLVLVQADLPAAWHVLTGATSAGARWAILCGFLVPSAVSCWLDAHGWLAAFGGRKPGVGFGRLLSIRVAGEAVNQATPLLSLGGEPVKAMLLSANGGYSPETTTGLADSGASVAGSRFVIDPWADPLRRHGAVLDAAAGCPG